MSAFAAGPFENGAAIMSERDARGRERWAIFDAAGGAPVRRMYDREAAIAFAEALPVPADLEELIPPHELQWSHRAAGRAAEVGGQVAVPVEEPNDGTPAHSMSEARRRSGSGPSDRNPAVLPRPREST